MNATPDSELQGERSWPALLDVATESNGIDLAAVRRYRQERVRAEMAARPVNPTLSNSDGGHGIQANHRLMLRRSSFPVSL